MELGYTVIISTRQAQQLWQGRKKSSTRTFIPGILDFHHALHKNSNPENPTKMPDNLLELGTDIQAITKAIRHEAEQLKTSVLRQAPSNLVAEPIEKSTDRKSIKFKSELARQAAVMIVCFDELAKWDNIAAALSRDLGCKFHTQPGHLSRNYHKKIRAILYGPRTHIAAAPLKS